MTCQDRLAGMQVAHLNRLNRFIATLRGCDNRVRGRRENVGETLALQRGNVAMSEFDENE